MYKDATHSHWGRHLRRGFTGHKFCQCMLIAQALQQVLDCVKTIMIRCIVRYLYMFQTKVPLVNDRSRKGAKFNRHCPEPEVQIIFQARYYSCLPATCTLPKLSSKAGPFSRQWVLSRLHMYLESTIWLSCKVVSVLWSRMLLCIISKCTWNSVTQLQ